MRGAIWEELQAVKQLRVAQHLARIG